MPFVDGAVLARAIAATTSLAGMHGLHVRDAIVLQNSNKLGLRLLPCDVFARAALVGEEVAGFEVQIAQGLAAVTAPVASLDPRVEPRVYEHDGFAVTFWTHYATIADRVSPSDYAHALHRLHTAMRSVEIEAPHFTERIAEAERLVAHRDETPALVAGDRLLLLNTLRDAAHAIRSRETRDQLLHGEPHSGNILSTSDGPRFIDFETCCGGPIEFDVAHLPEEVSLLYPDVDPDLLQQCRLLVLGMVAAWRWDARDEYPNGHRHGLNIIRLLREGPPWPALDALSTE
jgi:hypothetical protein